MHYLSQAIAKKRLTYKKLIVKWGKIIYNLESNMENTEIKYTAAHIANYFIETPIYTDNIRLNKLVYIAYGFYYAYFDKALFSEVIEAWKFGPVIPSIYHSLKHYSYQSISTPYNDNPFSNEYPRIDYEDENLKAILEGVITIYGKMLATSLINRTHKKGTPWAQVYKAGYFNIEINEDIIKNYYKKLLNQK